MDMLENLAVKESPHLCHCQKTQRGISVCIPPLVGDEVSHGGKDQGKPPLVHTHNAPSAVGTASASAPVMVLLLTFLSQILHHCPPKS